MKSTDKFLVGIVAGIILLVGAVLVVAFLRPNQPAYQPDDTPEGVAHNYLLALQLNEYERAYEYLLPILPGYPDSPDAFERDIEDHPWGFDHDSDNVSLAIESVEISGDKAQIVVRRTQFYRGGLFDSGQRGSTFDMTLRREASAWKVAESDRYWASCWEWSQGCP
jgi:hypothetical protein